jgi:hypothetical protein
MILEQNKTLILVINLMIRENAVLNLQQHHQPAPFQKKTSFVRLEAS